MLLNIWSTEPKNIDIEKLLFIPTSCVFDFYYPGPGPPTQIFSHSVLGDEGIFPDKKG